MRAPRSSAPLLRPPPTLTRPPGLIRRIGRKVYDFAYEGLRVMTLLYFRPIFLIRWAQAAPTIPSGPLLICANHASYLDPAFLQLVIRRRIVFVMTNDFYRLPLGRWFFWTARAIPVATGRLSKIGLERALRQLRKGQAVGIFPEGRLSPDGGPTPPQRGVSLLARMGQAPVLPLGIYGNRQAWPRGARWARRADVRVGVAPLIPPPPAHPAPGRTGERAFAQRIMAAVAEARAGARKSGRGTDP